MILCAMMALALLDRRERTANGLPLKLLSLILLAHTLDFTFIITELGSGKNDFKNRSMQMSG